MTVLSFPARSRPRSPGLTHGIGALFTGALQAWRDRQADRAMAGLSDHMLHDIGVSRSEITEVVRHGRPVTH
jgi:uncharacterized protein YjiS (DUF1127 family)